MRPNGTGPRCGPGLFRHRANTSRQSKHSGDASTPYNFVQAPQLLVHGPIVVDPVTCRTVTGTFAITAATVAAASANSAQSCSRYRTPDDGGSSPACGFVTRHSPRILTAHQAPLSSRPSTTTQSRDWVRTFVTFSPHTGQAILICEDPAAGSGGRVESADIYQSSGLTARRSRPVNSSTVHCCANLDINGAPIFSFNAADRRFVVKIVRRFRSSR